MIIKKFFLLFLLLNSSVVKAYNFTIIAIMVVSSASYYLGYKLGHYSGSNASNEKKLDSLVSKTDEDKKRLEKLKERVENLNQLNDKKDK